MLAIQKLVRNGNATQITIARPILIHLGWRPGDPIEVELTDAGELIVRRFRRSETVSMGSRPVIATAPAPVLP